MYTNNENSFKKETTFFSEMKKSKNTDRFIGFTSGSVWRSGPDPIFNSLEVRTTS